MKAAVSQEKPSSFTAPPEQEVAEPELEPVAITQEKDWQQLFIDLAFAIATGNDPRKGE